LTDFPRGGLLAPVNKQSWIVRVQCVVEKEVITTDCTEAEARDNPWNHFDSERELSQPDFTVHSVEPNL
jgi:hypothetical protein